MVGGASDGHSDSIGLLEGGKGTRHVFLSVQQATPGAFQVLNDCDDVRHDAELLLLLPPRECHTPSPPVCRASHYAVPGLRSSFFPVTHGTGEALALWYSAFFFLSSGMERCS